MYIVVNEIKIYYEVYGEGKPIILLHGNRQSHEIFDKLSMLLSKKYKVYLIDSRCHGKSDNGEISYQLMCDDVIKFIEKLNIRKPILYGFSDGAIISLLVSIKREDLISKIILSGVNLNYKGFKLSMRIYCIFGYIFTKNKLFRLMIEEPNIKESDLNKINIETVLIFGQYDIIKKNHIQKIYQNIKNSKIEILEKETHGSYIKNNKIYDILKKYIGA